MLIRIEENNSSLIIENALFQTFQSNAVTFEDIMNKLKQNNIDIYDKLFFIASNKQKLYLYHGFLNETPGLLI